MKRTFGIVVRYALALMLLLWLWPEVKVWPQTNAVDRAKEIQRALQRAEYQIASDLADSAIALKTIILPRLKRLSPIAMILSIAITSGATVWRWGSVCCGAPPCWTP